MKALPASSREGAVCAFKNCQGTLYVSKRMNVYILECTHNATHYRAANESERGDFLRSQITLETLTGGDKCPFNNCAGVLKFLFG
jgi:hypothetical protein